MISIATRGDLTQARASYDSIQGKISTNWSLENGTYFFHGVVPPNSEATVDLPNSDISSVEEGGRNITACPEIQRVPNSGGDAQFLIRSGDYNFTCETP
jgi:alpha-L-rhamnosidase